MTTRARVWLAGVALAAVGLILHLAGKGTAGDNDEAKEAILKIAAALEKGDAGAAKTQAEALAKKIEEIEDVMNLMKPRSKKGLGVGDKPGAIQPDGIELKLVKMGRDAPGGAAAKKEAKALEKMAYVIQAIAEVARLKPPKDESKKKQKEWVRMATAMRDAAPGLAKAAQSKAPAELQKAAAKLNSACNSCHTEFK
jgi:hypothetical protein